MAEEMKREVIRRNQEAAREIYNRRYATTTEEISARRFAAQRAEKRKVAKIKVVSGKGAGLESRQSTTR